MTDVSEDEVINALMDDDTKIYARGDLKANLKAKEKAKVEVRAGSKRVQRISDVELTILKCLRSTKNVRLISRMTGYPEIVVTKALERLIEKGYVDDELNVLRDVEIKVRRAGRSRSKLVLIDVAIAIAALIFVIALAYYVWK